MPSLLRAQRRHPLHPPPYWSGAVGVGGLLMLKLICRGLGLYRQYARLLCYLIGRTGLFDADYYLSKYQDVAKAGGNPLWHYVMHGDHELRSPMPLFEPSFYLGQVGLLARRVNSLLHYAWVGRYLGGAPSPWFDVNYYLAENPDVKISGGDPLLHYMRHGAREGRSPSAHFDAHYYLENNPSVRARGENPLLHYLQEGRLKGGGTAPALLVDEIKALQDGSMVVPDDILSERVPWTTLVPRAHVHDAIIDVVVPVYSGRIETLRCLYSVLAGRGVVTFELLVINDASPDALLVADLRYLAGLGLFTLIEQSDNFGFVNTVNAGMSLHSGRDVVLLNADAEVYGNWLDRLHKVAYADEGTGTVTPLSNNATICSYPRFLHDNPYPLEISYADIDRLASIENIGIVVEAPTAVGFCMYIKRASLVSCGLFDAGAFGLGYGEENDFCQRLVKAGWRNLIASEVFVRHWGSISFKGDKAKRISLAREEINRRYPGYRWAVRRFIGHDPLKVSRANLDWARLRMEMKDENVLIVCHGSGGEAERHIREDAARLGVERGVFFLRPVKKGEGAVTITTPAIKQLLNIDPIPLTDRNRLIAALQRLGISEIHIHGLAEFSADFPDLVSDLVRGLRIRMELHLHDYRVICPRINLMRGGRYCGEPDEAGCDACLREGKYPVRGVSIGDWRAKQAKILNMASRIVVLDMDVANRLARYFPGVEISVVPHEQFEFNRAKLFHQPLGADEPIRIAVIGALSRAKGYDILLACADMVRKESLPIEFILMGYSVDDGKLASAGVRITGRYQEQDVLEKLHSILPHVVWLPSIFPEAYSYTLTLALKQGLPVLAFDIGAIASRMRRYDMEEWIVPLEWHDNPEKLVRFLLGHRGRFEALVLGS